MKGQDMGSINGNNLRKTYYYLKKNGLKNAYYAVLERLLDHREQAYRYEEPTEETLRRQRVEGKRQSGGVRADSLVRQTEEAGPEALSFSILVPAYETRPDHLKEMVDSVLRQSYERWELVIADASSSRQVEQTLADYQDERIRYVKLRENRGISANTNQALKVAGGDYVGLLDHDDVLTPDALFEMAKAIKEAAAGGCEARMLYSDEDKGNGELTEFYEPHRKPGFNMDLLLSNNYICHFLVMKRELMQTLGFREAYDGAQDYDLVLRAAGRLVYETLPDGEGVGRGAILHIPKVLYHWRCHRDSTAANPESKRYAYEAGKRALEDFLRVRGWQGEVRHTLHLGFYHIEYKDGILAQRQEVGVVGGSLWDRRGRMKGGIYEKDESCPFQGLNRHFSGYMHRAVLTQEAYAVDARCMQVRKELRPLWQEVFESLYPEGAFSWEPDGEIRLADSSGTVSGKDAPKRTVSEEELRRLCLIFAEKVREQGYTVVWMPSYQKKG